MHTLTACPIAQDCFEVPIDKDYLRYLEHLRQQKQFARLCNDLPQGWLQRRIVTANYAVLRNMILQRRNHKLKEWHTVLHGIRSSVKHPELLPALIDDWGDE